MGTYPFILSVWIQPTIHSFNNITPKKKRIFLKIKHKKLFQNVENLKFEHSNNF